MDLSLARIEEILAEHSAAPLAEEGRPRAAVAALLRYTREFPDVLLMKRATRPGDQWSGQVSFPGGREQPEDPNLLTTAVRETREEVGIDLHGDARLLGQLEPLPAATSPILVAPYVFVQTRDRPVVLGPEAEEAFWFPLDRALRGDLDDVYYYRHIESRLRFDCWRYEGHVVWGLTYRMLSNLLGLVAREP
jgi:8-oxo-dGTP pyrophosphatase MutT (NUDIX family)